MSEGAFDNETRSDGNEDGLRNELISETVRQATRSRFYHNLYHAQNIEVESIQSIADLSSLPIVTKEDLREAGSDSLCVDQSTVVSHLQNTSGTTNRPFFVYRSVAESAFIREFYAGLNRSRDSDRDVPVMLQVQFPHHGTPTSIPANLFVIPFSVQDNQLLDRTIELLDKTFTIPGVEDRVTILSGSQGGIQVLTGYMIEQRIPCHERFEIQLVHLQGRYLTKRWRSLLESIWGAKVSDKYSLSEVFGGARRCGSCDGFHFEPNVVAEVVSLDGGNALEEGVGVLLLTSLYPFVQAQPMIRYQTGDLFRVQKWVCHSTRYEFLGRLSHALLDPRDASRVLLTGVDVLEVLDQHPEVNRTSRFADTSKIAFDRATGRLLARGTYELTRSGFVELKLWVETCVPIGLYPHRKQDLAQDIVTELLARSRALSNLISEERGSLDVEFVKPGTVPPLERVSTLWSPA